MPRLALSVVVVAVVGAGQGACRGGPGAGPPPASPSAPAPPMVTPGCDDATLRAFDPGLPGIERVAIEDVEVPDPRSTREHVAACEVTEDDEACRERASRDLLARAPDAELGGVGLQGDPDGWAAQLDVDGQRRELRVATELDVVAEARRLAGLGHQVTLVEAHRLYLAAGREAVVTYQLPLPAGHAPRRRWQARLRWPIPSEQPSTLEQLQREAAGANLVLLRFAVEATGLTAELACP